MPTKKQINGHVIRVDHYGNLITNIKKDTFDFLSKDKLYSIQIGSEKFRKIHTQYNQVEEGECFILFNAIGCWKLVFIKALPQNYWDLIMIAR